ncbi:hypothetical protein HK096_003464 [Nowakowskiella sp. JEL0078]|nr:hypothetical protein HK096_003464 [Nowakowskiella sp. JEL0078]
MHSTCIKLPELPTEILLGIIANIRNPSDILNFSCVCLRFSVIGKIALRTSITFHSMMQRIKLENLLLSAMENKKHESFVQATQSPGIACNDTFLFDLKAKVSVLMQRFGTLQKLDFGFDTHNELSSDLLEEELYMPKADGQKLYGRVWEHRFVNQSILDITKFTPNMKYLGLRGCQFYDSVLEESLTNINQLGQPRRLTIDSKYSLGIRVLNLSYSSIKDLGLQSIIQNCGCLESLYLDGIFRFGRQDCNFLPEIVKNCPRLKILSILNCPLAFKEIRENCLNTRAQMMVSGESLQSLRLYWSDGLSDKESVISVEIRNGKISIDDYLQYLSFK